MDIEGCAAFGSGASVVCRSWHRRAWVRAGEQAAAQGEEELVSWLSVHAVSAFDDEFGLFGDEEAAEKDEERTSTLGARRIASDEAAHDDIEPEDERPRRGPRGGGRRERSADDAGGAARRGAGGGRREYGDRGSRKTEDPKVAQERALDLLGFLARKLVSKPASVLVEEVETDKGPLVELVVEHEDLGKVIGRSGRVAQALRTLVRASAEGRISIDIISFEDETPEGGTPACCGP